MDINPGLNRYSDNEQSNNSSNQVESDNSINNTNIPSSNVNNYNDTYMYTYDRITGNMGNVDLPEQENIYKILNSKEYDYIFNLDNNDSSDAPRA
jgi:hypothetical protein